MMKVLEISMSSEVSIEIDVSRDLLTLPQHTALPNQPLIVTRCHILPYLYSYEYRYCKKASLGSETL